MMEEKGVPIYSIVILLVLFLCCFACIGCCAWACKKRKESKKIADSETDGQPLENVVVHELGEKDEIKEDQKGEQQKDAISAVELQDQATASKK